MKNIVRLFFGTMLAGIALTASAGTVGTFEQTKENFDLIHILANQLCDEVPLHGTERHLELTAEAKAKVKGAIKALADAGVSGSAKYSSEEYSGLLQKDLPAAIQTRNECRKYYFPILLDRLMPKRGGSNASSAATLMHSSTLAPVSLTFDDFSFETQSNTLFLRAVFNNSGSNPVTVTSISFDAASHEDNAMTIIAEPQWKPLTLPPHAATPFNFIVQLGERQINEFAQPVKLPERLFVSLRAIDSRGKASASTKHFMTLDYVQTSHAVIGTLFAMPLSILEDTTPIYSFSKGTFVVAKALMRAAD